MSELKLREIVKLKRGKVIELPPVHGTKEDVELYIEHGSCGEVRGLSEDKVWVGFVICPGVRIVVKIDKKEIVQMS